MDEFGPNSINKTQCFERRRRHRSKHYVLLIGTVGGDGSSDKNKNINIKLKLRRPTTDTCALGGLTLVEERLRRILWLPPCGCNINLNTNLGKKNAKKKCRGISTKAIRTSTNC